MEYIKVVLNGKQPEVFTNKRDILNWSFQLMIDQLKYMSLDGIKQWIITATEFVEENEYNYQLKKRLNQIRENCDNLVSIDEAKKYVFNIILQLDGLGVVK